MAFAVFVPVSAGFCRGETPPTVVYPTGSFPTDPQNVQAAVDAGGQILLKAVDVTGVPTPFDFGPSVSGGGSVHFTADVDIEGEELSNAVTTIKSGFLPFQHDAATIHAPVRSSIRRIFFDGPGATALFVESTTGVVFVHNTVVNIVGFLYIPPDTFKSQGVWITNNFNFGHMTGGIWIEDNLIDHSLGNYGYGIAIACVDTDVHINRNRIRETNLAGILVAISTATFEIEDNVIESGPGFDLNYPSDAIFIEFTSDEPFSIRNNTLRCENPYVDCIAIRGTEVPLKKVFQLPHQIPANGHVSHATVSGNNISLAPADPPPDALPGAITMYGAIRDSSFAQNRLVGNGSYGFAGTLNVTPQDLVDSNIFVDNSISEYASGVADVFFDTNTLNNKFVGRVDSVIDLGIGNQFKDGRRLTNFGKRHELAERLRVKLADIDFF